MCMLYIVTEYGIDDINIGIDRIWVIIFTIMNFYIFLTFHFCNEMCFYEWAMNLYGACGDVNQTCPPGLLIQVRVMWLWLEGHVCLY